MKLNNRKLYKLLKEKGIQSLYHANTVATSITFIEENGLLSREYIEKRKLFQTPQTSDEIDKLFDVFDDIFLDTTDLHKYFFRQNHYGPVLFKFSIELLLDDNFEIWVTKDNPIYWSKRSDISNNYFKSVNELSKKWNKHERQRKMLTIKKPNSPILFNYLESITLDNPKVTLDDDLHLFNESRKALKKILQGNLNLRNMLVWRKCNDCYCADNYLNQVPIPELIQKFLPAYHAEFEK